eukprot:scaffold318484_cov21-Tisochrysis_lutea.AAC.1
MFNVDTASASRMIHNSSGRHAFVLRSAGSSKQQQQQQVVVVVWDLDETLVLFQSLCNGAYAAEVNRSLQHGGSHCAAIPLVDPAAAHA